MESLKLDNINPCFISDAGTFPVSEIWFNSLVFNKGELCLISAESGQGKSSLLSFIFGERNDYSGGIYFDGTETGLLKRHEWQSVRQKNLSCVFQGLRLFSDLTAMENIQLKNRITKHKSRAEIEYLLEKTGLHGKTDEKAGRLSFGQKQRVAIIRALCQPFDFILLDEPFSHLDDKNIETVAEIISSELAERNAGMLLFSLGSEYPFNYCRKCRL